MCVSIDSVITPMHLLSKGLRLQQETVVSHTARFVAFLFFLFLRLIVDSDLHIFLCRHQFRVTKH